VILFITIKARFFNTKLFSGDASLLQKHVDKSIVIIKKTFSTLNYFTWSGRFTW